MSFGISSAEAPRALSSSEIDDVAGGLTIIQSPVTGRILISAKLFGNDITFGFGGGYYPGVSVCPSDGSGPCSETELR